MLKISILDMSLKTSNSRLQPNVPGAYELNVNITDVSGLAPCALCHQGISRNVLDLVCMEISCFLHRTGKNIKDFVMTFFFQLFLLNKMDLIYCFFYRAVDLWINIVGIDIWCLCKYSILMSVCFANMVKSYAEFIASSQMERLVGPSWGQSAPF